MSNAELPNVTLRRGLAADDPEVARMFFEMWRDIGYPETELLARAEADARTCAFLERGRHDARVGLASVIAEQITGDIPRIVGCAVCQLHDGLYPPLLRPEARLYGYIWGVYVIAEQRGRGLGARLTRRCMDILAQRGCSHAILNAAPKAVGLYARLGFTASNEMRCPL